MQLTARPTLAGLRRHTPCATAVAVGAPLTQRAGASSHDSLSVRVRSSSEASSSAASAGQAFSDAVHGLPERKQLGNEAWHLGFQVNERWLDWDTNAQLQLLRMVLSDKLETSVDDVDQRLNELALLLPDFLSRIERTRADILLPMISDLPAFAIKLIELKDIFQGINFSALACKYPPLLTDFTVQDLKQRLQAMREALPGVRVEMLVAEEPALLKADIPKVLADVRRLMGSSVDPVNFLVSQPRSVLSMNDAGLESALDVEGFAPRGKSS